MKNCRCSGSFPRRFTFLPRAKLPSRNHGSHGTDTTHAVARDPRQLRHRRLRVGEVFEHLDARGERHRAVAQRQHARVADHAVQVAQRARGRSGSCRRGIRFRRRSCRRVGCVRSRALRRFRCRRASCPAEPAPRARSCRPRRPAREEPLHDGIAGRVLLARPARPPARVHPGASPSGRRVVTSPEGSAAIAETVLPLAADR